MAFAQRTLSGQTARRRAWAAGARVPGAMVGRAVSVLVRLVFGSGGGYRNYPRERLPEIELHRVVAGRKDRLDGLL